MKKLLLFFMAICLGSSLWAQPLSLTASQETVPQGAEAVVAVTCQDFSTMFTLQYSTTWDPLIAQFDSVDAFHPNLNLNIFVNFGLAGTAGGTLTFSWDDPTFAGVNIPDGDTLFLIHYTAIGSAGDSTGIDFGSVPTVVQASRVAGGLPQVITTNLTNGYVRIQPLVSAGFELILPHKIAPQASTVIMPVTTKDFINLVSLQFSVNWDTSIIVFDSVGIFHPALNLFEAVNFGLTNTIGGQQTFAWDDASLQGVSVPDADTIYVIYFTTVGNPGDVSPVSFTSTPTLMLASDVPAGGGLPTRIPITPTDGSVTIAGGNICQTFSANAIAFNSTCGLTNGSVDVTATGGLPPYDYLWNTGATTPFVGSLLAGQYIVTVTDFNLCTFIDTVVVLDIAGAVVDSISITNEDCNLTNGQLEVHFSGGTAPVNILWSNMQTTSVIGGLSAGTYTVVLTDGNSCVDSASATVLNIAGPSITGLLFQDENCGQADGTASVIFSGGTPVFNILWSHGATGVAVTGLVAGAYTVTVVDGSGCADSATFGLSNLPGPTIAGFTVAADTCGRGVGSATVISTGAKVPFTYLWNTGDVTATISGQVAGQYIVTVTDTSGCSATDTIQIGNVQGITISGIVTTDDTCALGVGTALVQFSFGNPAQIFWNTGDTTAFIDSLAGGQNVSVRVIDSAGCFDTASIVIGARKLPGTSIFTGLVSGSTLTLTDASTGGPVAWAWDFGDGASSTLQNPTHVYAANGTYTVCLIITDSCGQDTSCQQFSVTAVCAGPVVAIGFTTSLLTATFTDQSTTTGSTVTWAWDFGDGNTSNLQNPVHTYAAAGNYMVCLAVSDSCGIDTACDPVNIICPPPTAQFTSVSTLLAANFTDGSISSNTIASWAWDFGDGGSSTIQNPTHTYTTAGTYTVCLIVTDSCGIDTFCRPMVITCPPPVAAFTETSVLLTTSFVDASISSSAITSWAWDFGDGATSAVQSPTHAYASAGTYTACLIVNSICGADTICQQVTVTCPPPGAAFTETSTLLLATFIDASVSSSSIATWSWDFGDGATSVFQNPTHIYATAGTYTVCLAITDTCGTDTICQQVTIICNPPTSDFSASSLLLTASFTDLSTSINTITSWAWDFGDGNSSTLQNPSHIYAAGGTYTVCLIVGDVCGFDTICNQVTIICPPPTAAFTETSVLLTANFIDGSTSANPITSWSWDFGDGATSATQSPSHAYAAAGTYTVCLIVTDTCGADTACQQVTVVCPAPIADFTQFSAFLMTSFTDASTSSSTISSWSWDFGDGNSSALQNPTHTYAGPGTYNVCLMISDTCGVDTFCRPVTVTCPPPVGIFTSTTTLLTVSFTDGSSSSDTVSVWAWDFGDNSNGSAQQNPTHTYATAGTYVVCLIVGDTCGFDTICRPVVITCPPPTAAFTQTSALLTASFIDGSISANPITSWSWDFGDGATSTVQNPTHPYAAAGTYTVCLIVVDTCGADTICLPVVITCPPPTAAFTQASTLLTANFTDGSISSSTITNWSWDFGDGATSSVQNPTHPYAAAGTYTVCLIVSDTCGSDTICLPVVITCPPPAAAFVNTSLLLTASFTDLSFSSNTIASWLWDFGDGNSSTLQNPAHTYAASGTYTVCLMISDTCGMDTFCTPVIILCPPPVALFTQVPNQLDVNFVDGSTSSSTITSWAWDFGDGNSSTLQSPSHTYAAAGTYTVCLIVSDTCGSDTFCMPVTVICAPPVGAFIHFDAGLTYSFFDQSSNNPTTWAWDFGDGMTSALPNPAHTYATRDTFVVCLIVSNQCGSDTICDTLDLSLPYCTPNWTFINTGEDHTIVILGTANLMYNGQPLPDSSYIGVFYLDQNGVEQCGGFTQWFGSTTAFPAFGDDATTPAIKEGFGPGERFRFKAYIPCECGDNVDSISFVPLGGVFTHDSTYATNGITGIISLSASGLLVDAQATGAACGLSNGTATANVTGGIMPYDYLWSNGATTMMISGLMPGIYSVIVTDTLGCMAMDTVTVDSIPGPTVSGFTVQDETCGMQNGTATVNVVPGTPPYRYIWSNGDTTQMADSLAAGTYIIMVTDSFGCTVTDSVVVGFIPGPTIAGIAVSHDTCAVNSGSLTVSVTGSSFPFTITWSTGFVGPTLSGVGAGTYIVTVMDSNSCVAVDSATVIGIPGPTITGFDTTRAYCGHSNGGARVNVTGGTTPYTYLWGNGATTQAISGVPTGPYAVTVTDSLGCTAIDTMIIPCDSIECQTCNLRQGWNLLSSYVDPLEDDMDSIFQAVVNDIWIVKNDTGQSYIPNIVNTITHGWSIQDGYNLKTYNPTTLVIKGPMINTTLNPVLLAQGWSIIPYHRDYDTLVTAAMATVLNDIYILKDQDGNAFIPSFSIDQVGYLRPCQGYKLKMINANIVTYMAHSPIVGNWYRPVAAPSHFAEPINTGNNATIILSEVGASGVLNPGDEIGIYSPEGMLIGASVYQGGHLAMTVWGDDPTTPVLDGLQYGAKYTFARWDQASGNIEPLDVIYVDGDESYRPDGISIISLQRSTRIDDRFGLTEYPSCYPNPTAADVYFDLKLDKSAQATIEIHDMLGRVVGEISQLCTAGDNTLKIDLGKLSAGTYTWQLMIGDESRVAYRSKLVVQ